MPKPQSGAGDHARHVPDSVDRFTDAIGDDLGVLDEIGRAVDHTGNEDGVTGRRIILDRAIFVLMSRVGEFDAECPDIGLIEDREQLAERKIVRMRAFPVSPAAVQPDLRARDSAMALFMASM